MKFITTATCWFLPEGVSTLEQYDPTKRRPVLVLTESSETFGDGKLVLAWMLMDDWKAVVGGCPDGKET